MNEFTCIVCPNGCRVKAEIEDGQYVFSGNKCSRGEDFAKTELTAPMRSVTTTVKTIYKSMPALPVRTNGEVRKEMIPKIMRALADVLVSEEIRIGDTVVRNILGTGCDIIATGNIIKSAAGKEEMPC